MLLDEGSSCTMGQCLGSDCLLLHMYSCLNSKACNMVKVGGSLGQGPATELTNPGLINLEFFPVHVYGECNTASRATIDICYSSNRSCNVVQVRICMNLFILVCLHVSGP